MSKRRLGPPGPPGPDGSPLLHVSCWGWVFISFPPSKEIHTCTMYLYCIQTFEWEKKHFQVHFQFQWCIQGVLRMLEPPPSTAQAQRPPSDNYWSVFASYYTNNELTWLSEYPSTTIDKQLAIIYLYCFWFIDWELLLILIYYERCHLRLFNVDWQVG